MSHFEERLEADLGNIRQFVWDMGDDVERALRQAKQALLTRDAELAYETVLGDNPINRDSRACDRLCHTFIARHLPGAGHLREMAATIRVNVALERIGDYAVTISRESLQLEDDLSEKFTVQIDLLADESLQILHEARKAFRDDNAESAMTLMKMAKQVENNMDAIYDQLFAEENGMKARTALTVFVVFNLLKRVADQAKNICDQTVYAVRGVAKLPRVYRLLFLARPGSGLGHLAAAIGRKNFPTSARFDVATPDGAEGVPPALAGFLDETGIPDDELESLNLSHLEHDLSDYDVIIALEGRYADYVNEVPFHTTALNWSPAAPDGADGYSATYRDLHGEIQSLIDLMAGDEAA
ncbi:phosphate signaling complex PhoU family protein [Elongatibacter sediminis]|uniref:PhoU domain-containing protein n=1 Tax=Elongatibacter sediminis TaxID=3119006 RepID=A0AAW9R5F7_9GAMM